MSPNEEAVKHRCAGCGDSSLSVFFEMPHMPTYVNFLWTSAEEAKQSPRGDITLASQPGFTCFQIWLPLNFEAAGPLSVSEPTPDNSN